jgi:hypothetical protein
MIRSLSLRSRCADASRRASAAPAAFFADDAALDAVLDAVLDALRAFDAPEPAARPRPDDELAVERLAELALEAEAVARLAPALAGFAFELELGFDGDFDPVLLDPLLRGCGMTPPKGRREPAQPYASPSRRVT